MRRKLEKAARLLSALLVFFLLYLIFVYTKLDLSAPIATPQTMLEIGQSVASDKKNSALFAQCPARIYSGIWHRPHIDNILFSRRIRAAYCKKTPDKCLQKCTNGKNGEYCFELARAFETYEWPQEIGTLEMQDFSGRLFALACAYGSAAGCTNRAAGIRNDRHSEDPFNDLASQQPKIKACLFSTFQLACGAKDAWG